MEIKYQSEQHPEKISKEKHIKIPFTVCMSAENEKPNPFKDEMHHFSDSNTNTITYKVPKQTTLPFLYLHLKPSEDCILRVIASACDKPIHSMFGSHAHMKNLRRSISLDVNNNLSLLPGQKTILTEVLHKRDA